MAIIVPSAKSLLGDTGFILSSIPHLLFITWEPKRVFVSLDIGAGLAHQDRRSIAVMSRAVDTWCGSYAKARIA